MNSSLQLRQKFTFQAYDRKVVFIKKPMESIHHVIMKALLWALYLPTYPHLVIEMGVGSRYKPDLAEIDSNGRPLFWGEAGRLSNRKMRTLLTRYRRTHFAFARWGTALAPFENRISKAVPKSARKAPADLIIFPEDSDKRFISANGRIELHFSDVLLRRLPAV
jgi:hypothetical protein